MAIRKPADIDPLAEKLLSRLAGKPECSQIVLGGYFALKHYLNYRPTHDIDAWWKSRLSTETAQTLESATRELAVDEKLGFNKRIFGDTVSFELLQEKQRVFSFQIAERTVELESPVQSEWPPILIETLADNVGAKMNALVDRGAPRDFTDIQEIVNAPLLNIADCWGLWMRKNPTSDSTSAKEKVRMHLTALQARRPIDSIRDSRDRESARATRHWFLSEFLKP